MDIEGAVTAYLARRTPMPEHLLRLLLQPLSAEPEEDGSLVPIHWDGGQLLPSRLLPGQLGMLRGSSGLFRQRSAHHLMPLIETIASAPDEVWNLDLDGYDTQGIDLVLYTAKDVRRALRPVEASDILVNKVMLGVFGCVPAFEHLLQEGLRRLHVRTRSAGTDRRVLPRQQPAHREPAGTHA